MCDTCSVAGVIVWLNGTFGVGKTSTSALLAESLPDARVFDTEEVGFLLRPLLGSIPVRDFQEWPPWRRLVVEVAAQTLAYAGGTLVIPQTVLVEEYWDEIIDGLGNAGICIHHFVLHADHSTLTRRIDADDTLPAAARRWRFDHVAEYERARAWLARRSHVIDTTHLTPDDVAACITSTLREWTSA